MLLAGVAVLTASLSLTACVDQHPDSTEGQSQADSVRLVATSPAAAQICDKLELDLVGVCRTSGRNGNVAGYGDFKILIAGLCAVPEQPAKRFTAEICVNPGEIPVFKFKKCIRHVCFNCRPR